MTYSILFNEEDNQDHQHD